MNFSKGKINIKLDVEDWDCDFWISNDRFKEFSERENLGLEFFPVLVENKRRYLVSWRKLPTFWSYDLDLEENEYDEYWLKKWEPNYVFSSDVIQYYDWKMFCGSAHVSKYITWDIKEKMEKENFLFIFQERKCTQKAFNKKVVEEHLKKSRKDEKKTLNKLVRKEYEDTDEALEKILIEDWETEILEKFRNEMKGIWKKDFDRYEKGRWINGRSKFVVGKLPLELIF